MRRRRFLTLTAAAALIPAAARAERIFWQAEALGGTVSVELSGAVGDTRAVMAGIAALIAEVEAAVSLFRPDSALSVLNSTGVLPDPPPVLRDLMALADAVHRQTGGMFDPTVQPLWQALAQGGDTAQARRLIGWPGLDAQGMARLRPGQCLTFNGIAQGYAADRARAVLLAAGYHHALIDLGEFAAIGGPFRLGIEDPAYGLMATRQLQGGAIATSSPGAMSLGETGHILGPRCEGPRWSTLSVEADSAALADGLSTAMCLMKAPQIRAVMRADPRVRRVVAVSRDGDLTSWAGA